MLKRINIIVILIMCIALVTSCRVKEKTRYEAEFLNLFDTATMIVGYADNKEEFKNYTQIIYDTLSEYHKLYDIYNDYDGINNIKTINDNAGIKPVKVDKRIIDLLLFSKEEYKQTNGKTNIAFGSVLKLWHDYREEGIENLESASLPPIEELKKLNEHTNINDIIINIEESTVFLKDPKMSLDVGAIAKGYATEETSQKAINSGFTKGLISVGGNIRAIGTKQGNKNSDNNNEKWNVGIQNPDKSSDEKALKVIYLQDMSLVTSGDYQRYYTVNGKKYNHIIDTETLFPAEYFVSVTIICENSKKADSLSTAVFSMPYEQGKTLIDNLDNTEAVWIFDNGDIKYTENFEKFLSN